MKLSVIIPAFNEEKNLSTLHARLTSVLERALPEGATHELIFVNDGSRDATLEGLRRLAETDPRVKFLSFSRNFGHEAAVAAGLDRAADDGCDAAVLIDADLQDPPELIADMITRWQQGVQVVYAQRRKRNGDPVLKKIAIFIFYRLLGRISEIDIPLDTGNFRLMDRRVVDVVRTCRENPRFIRGLVPWAGFRQEPVLFDRDARHAGETGYGFFKLARLALDGICSFSQVPLRVASWVGGIVIGLSIVATLIVIIDKFFFHPDLPKGFAFLACAMFFLSGVQLFLLGALAQYVGYIFKNVQNRPMYVVAEEGGFLRPEVVVRPAANGVVRQAAGVGRG